MTQTPSSGLSNSSLSSIPHVDTGSEDETKVFLSLGEVSEQEPELPTGPSREEEAMVEEDKEEEAKVEEDNLEEDKPLGVGPMGDLLDESGIIALLKEKPRTSSPRKTLSPSLF